MRNNIPCDGVFDILEPSAGRGAIVKTIFENGFIGEKEVLSGLSKNSFGNGCNKRTVLHVLLLEDFCGGKLKRKTKDFLCTSKYGSNGNLYSDQNLFIRWVDGENEKYMPAPTCKKCLKLLQKWKKMI